MRNRKHGTMILMGFLISSTAWSSVAFAEISGTSGDIESEWSTGSEPVEPIGTTVSQSLDGISSTNPYPAVPEAAEYGQLIRSRTATGALDSSLLGESIDYYTGETDFAATDVSLSGNSAVPVALGRRYHVTNHLGGVIAGAFGDWDLDIPHIEGIVATSVGWTVPATQIDARCTYFGAPPAASVDTDTTNGIVTTTVPAAEYNTGFTAVIPGLGRHELLLRANGTPDPSGAHPVTTKEMWAVSCVQLTSPQPGGPDEGFVVTTPDGITYTFNQGLTRPYTPLQRPADTGTPGVLATVDRQMVWMLPTKVTDRFGNAITYSYSQTSGYVVLTDITGSDGRHLHLSYNYLGTVVQSVSDGTRTWTYTYDTQTGALRQVNLPDGTHWNIDFSTFNKVQWTYENPTCTNLPAPSYSGSSTIGLGPYSGTIQAPTGALGTFTFAINRVGRNGAPNTCLTNSAGIAFAPVEPSVYDVLSLTKKQITGPHLNTLTWTLSYAGCSGNSCNTTTTTTITDPRNFKTAYTFGAQYGTNGTGSEGMLQSKQIASNARNEQYTYFSASGQPYPSVLGTPAQVRGDVSQLSSLRPVQTRTITQDGATYKQTRSNLDVYGFPQTITKIGTDTKTDTITYSHNTTDWVLGTVQKISSSGSDEIKLTLDSHSRPIEVDYYGRPDRFFSYYNDGPIHTIKDNDGNITTYTNYSLGIPKNIAYANGDVESVVVNSLGQITSHNNGAGRTTTYAYDSMGRLSRVTPPGSYNPTSITWNTTTNTGVGWSRTTKVGSATTTDTYDGFLRSVTTADNGGHTVNRTFDADGNALFVSYPIGGTYLTGITSTYDGLNRVLSRTDGDQRSTWFTYSANKISVQNPRNYYTDTSYKSYDEPTTAWPTSIVTPIATTTIHRDLWGKPTSIVRGNITRTLTYYGTQLLWKLTEPETGTTTYDYDYAANLKTIDHNGTGTETRTYDKRNRLTGITYSTGDAVSYSWYGDNQPHTSSRGNTTRTYSYNAGGLLTGESVSIDGTVYNLAYAYDSNRHQQSVTYPDNQAISLSPDAFGRPGQAGSYATNVTYHANGAIAGFTYGNGITHSLVLDDRMLPYKVGDSGLSNATITYDANGNPTGISDSIDGTHARTLTYDSLDRLHSASGPWGSSAITLDAQDNLVGDTTPPSISLGVNANNQLSGYVYDGRGNTASVPAMSGRAAMTYTFDTANLLTGLTQGGRNWSYTYDAAGYRSSSTGRPGTTISIYDRNGRLMAEKISSAAGTDTDANGSVTPETTSPITRSIDYIYLGSHLVAKVITAGSTTRTEYVHTDPLGTPTATTDADKAVLGKSVYAPFGSLVSWDGAGNETGPGYTNQYADATCLLYMRARYYDPILRRFISADPNPADAITGINFNRYAYANNSPYRFFDPSGRCSQGEVPDPSDDSPCPPPDDQGDDWWSSLKELSGNALDGFNELAIAMGPAGAPELFVATEAEELAAEAPILIAEVGQQLEAETNELEEAISSAKEITTLFRAVGPEELGDIEATGELRNLGAAEGKYFTTTAENAASYARQAVAGFGDPPYTIIRTEAPSSILQASTQATVDAGQIPALVIPNEYLPYLAPEILDVMPISQ